MLVGCSKFEFSYWFRETDTLMISRQAFPQGGEARKTGRSVQQLFSRRPRLPPPVHPKPLLRILPHIIFNH
jgi:hypothetical protein